jgi:hypothetical protein
LAKRLTPSDIANYKDADTLLQYVNPDAKTPEQIALLTREGCSFCAEAKKQLKEAGVEFAEVNLPHTIRTRVLGALAKAETVHRCSSMAN